MNTIKLKKMILKIFIKKKLRAVLALGLLTVLSLFSPGMVSCSFTDKYVVSIESYDSLQDEYEKSIQDFKNQKDILESYVQENEQLKAQIADKDKIINDKNNEIDALKEEIASKSIKNLEDQIKKLSTEPEKLRKLLNNMNKLLKYVYIGSSAPDELAYTFTAFSIEYKGKYFIITAGHCINDNYGKEGTFKFKANFSDEWIYPELLGYNAEFWKLKDYAVFYSDKVIGGLPAGELQTQENYLLGSIDKGLSVFRNLGAASIKGESGSPVINEEMEAIGIYVVYGYVYTPIQLALDVIDDMVMN